MRLLCAENHLLVRPLRKLVVRVVHGGLSESLLLMREVLGVELHLGKVSRLWLVAIDAHVHIPRLRITIRWLSVNERAVALLLGVAVGVRGRCIRRSLLPVVHIFRPVLRDSESHGVSPPLAAN